MTQGASAATLTARWAAGIDLDSFCEECLEAVVRQVGADRAVVFLGHGAGGAAPWRGRDRRDALAPPELEEVCRSVVESAFARGALATWDVSQARGHAGSASELGILAAVAAPIGSPVRGVLYVDFRSVSALRQATRTDVVAAVAAALGEAIAPLEIPTPSPVAAAPLPPPNLDELVAMPGMRAIVGEISSAIATAAPTLILGDTGTGKTLLAQAIAERSGRRPIVRTMLGTTDDFNTLVSELYGHTQGSYSGANRARRGLVEQASGGVLILDEILNLPIAAQQLLLDFVQFGTYRPLGHDAAEPRRARVHLIAVTNGDLDAAVREGRFRQDLFFRLAGSTLTVPRLRDRRGDIPGIAAAMLRGMEPSRHWRLSLDARRALLSPALEWPGNVRQLEAVLRRAVERARAAPGVAATEVLARHLDADLLARATEGRPITARAGSSEAAPPTDFEAQWIALQARRAALEQDELALIQAALEANGGVLAYAAQALGVPRTTLSSRLGGRGRGRPGDPQSQP